jgi:MtfA peptidase
MDSTTILIFIGGVLGALLVYRKTQNKKLVFYREPDREFPYQWKQILEERVHFYKKLNGTKKRMFEKKAHVFLLNVRIIGVRTDVTDLDRVLVAASATIPIFGFPNWHYRNLFEVFIYPDKFKIPETDKMARGLVGWGEMEGKMFLSRKALYQGYANQEDGLNVAIHEFIHVMDKQDGAVDGVLESVMREADITPWLHIIQSNIDKISEGNSSIRQYGLTNKAEFLAVVGEYFFENPGQMKIEHPDLYAALDSIFNPKIDPRLLYTSKYENCPCRSGQRFGDCCGKRI